MQKRAHWMLAALAAAMFCATIITARAQSSFSLSWNANPESDIVAYRVHVGTTSRQYSRVYEVQTNQVSISDLTPGQQYFFAVSALNSVGLESPLSDEAASSAAGSGTVLTSLLSPSSVMLRVGAPAGATVIFESSTDLKNWQMFASAIADVQGIATFAQPRNSLIPGRFFRARLP